MGMAVISSNKSVGFEYVSFVDSYPAAPSVNNIVFSTSSKEYIVIELISIQTGLGSINWTGSFKIKDVILNSESALTNMNIGTPPVNATSVLYNRSLDLSLKYITEGSTATQNRNSPYQFIVPPNNQLLISFTGTSWGAGHTLRIAGTKYYTSP